MFTPINMMPSCLPDFKQTHFPYLELERIHGQPTLNQIVKVYKQLKQHASSVPTSLAGDQHGYQPLVLTNDQWRTIPCVEEFCHPVNPGPFLPHPCRATNKDIAVDKARWEQCVAEYHRLANTQKQHSRTSSPPHLIMNSWMPSVIESPILCNPPFQTSSNICSKNMENYLQMNCFRRKMK